MVFLREFTILPHGGEDPNLSAFLSAPAIKSGMATARDGDWFPDSRNPEGTCVINDQWLVRRQDGHCVVMVAGIVLAQYSNADGLAAAHAMVSLVEQGWATQTEVSRAFRCSIRTVRRHQRRFEEGGLASPARSDGFPSGRSRVSEARRRLVQQLREEGHSQREIARRIGVSEKAVRKLLHRLGWRPVALAQPELGLNGPTTADPNLSAFSSASATPAAVSADRDSNNRSGDRLLARLGLLDDAPPLLGSARAVPRDGVLLAVPALLRSGIFDCAQQIYGSLGPAFFGLRTTLLTLLFMALWRIKRPKALKEHSPADLGRVLGVDRAPEVKTLRRKLARLASYRRAAQFGDALARQRVGLRGEVLGFLYIDGHVRVNHGQHRLPKAFVARMRLSMPATNDYWVNDTAGDPLLVITDEANAGLVKVFPIVLRKSVVWSARAALLWCSTAGGSAPGCSSKSWRPTLIS